MGIPWDSINGFAGATAIGAICVLAFFFILDGKDSNIFHTLNSYASTASWGILAAVPTIAISFLVGQFAILAGTLLSRLFSAKNLSELEAILTIAKAQNEFLAHEYLRIKQEMEILSGSSLSFVVLGVGSFFEIRNLGKHETIIIVCGLISILAGVGLFFLGIQKLNLLYELISDASQNFHLLKK